jgi:hypothetical protein
MYPFERFSQRAKHVLTLAQEEAERAHHSYIGTEHLLLALIREGDGLAGRALKNLGLEIRGVRTTIQSVLGRNERIVVQRIIPTSRVKKVIEIAFDEAARAGDEFVGTGHLLLALLIEGEGIAAHVLKDLGATIDKVRRELWRLLGTDGPEDGASAAAPARGGRRGRSTLRMTPDPALSAIIDSAQDAAQNEGALVLRCDHLLQAMIGQGSDAKGLLTGPPADVGLLSQKLKPPRAVTRLEAVYWKLHIKVAQAASAGNDELVRQLRQQESELGAQIDAALTTWRESWSAAP